jgi:broad specificity phosphatase PhoE
MENLSSSIVYLIRHGETDWNRDGRWQGHRDVPLSVAGRAQAKRLAHRLSKSEPRFDSLFSSDLSRALETARILGGALGLRPTATPELREINLGTWAGKTREEIALAFPGEWLRMQRNEDIPRGGGETFSAFQRRILEWLNRATKDQERRTICAVTHGGCIRAVLLHTLGLTWAERDRIPSIDNGSITIVERSAGEWKVVRMNDAQGLRDPRAEEDRTERNEGDPA